MHLLTLFFLILSVQYLHTTATTQQVYPRVYATNTNGVEVINVNAPGISLAYISNLVLNTFPVDNVYTIHYLADMGTPNFFNAQFIPMDVNYAFWTTGRSNLTGLPSMPFFSYDVYKNNIVGPAFPNNNTQILQPSKFVIQSVFVNPSTILRQDSAETFIFSSTLIDPQPRQGGTYVYLAGWGNNGFVVARAHINLDSIDPDVNFDPVTGVLGIPMPVQCYDQFSLTSRPIMKITDTALFLVVPGRCGFFAQIPLPGNVNWNSIPLSSISTYSPLDALSNLHYVSSAVISPLNDSTIYYARKTYSQHGAYLFSFDTNRWAPNSAIVNVDDIGEGEAVLVFGLSQPNHYLFLLAAGSNKVKRYTVSTEKNNIVLDAYATLYPTITHVSSALYFDPHLYFSTYEPDAKLVRVPISNFCSSFCGDNGYCNKGSCTCVEGYSTDPSISSFSCVLNSIAFLKDKEKSTIGASAALGVFFAFSLIAALAGWGLWWKERKLGYVAMS